MKSFRSTLVLLLIVAAVGGYIYVAERGPVAESGSEVLLRTDPNTVTTLSLQKSSTSAIQLRKIADNWTLTQNKPAVKEGPDMPADPDGSKSAADVPANPDAIRGVPADPDAVENLLKQVQLVQATSVMPADSARLKEFGLDKPQSSLTVQDAKIEFGAKPGSDPGNVYARIGDTIAVLPATLADSVAKPFGEWRDKAVLRVVLEETSQIVIQAPAVTATLLKTNDKTEDEASEWSILKPVGATADVSAVESFINELASAKTTKFLEDNPRSLERWGLDQPQVEMEVKTKNGTQKLLVGKKLKSGYAAQNSFSQVVFELPDATFALINRPLRAWRSKTVMKFDVADLTRLEVTARGTTRAYTQSDGKWQPGEKTEDAETANQAVLDMIIAAQNLSAQDFIDKSAASSAYGFDKPGVLLKMTSSSQSKPLTLQLAFPNDKVYARTATEDTFNATVYVLPQSVKATFKSALDKLFATPATPGEKKP